MWKFIGICVSVPEALGTLNQFIQAGLNFVPVQFVDIKEVGILIPQRKGRHPDIHFMEVVVDAVLTVIPRVPEDIPARRRLFYSRRVVSKPVWAAIVWHAILFFHVGERRIRRKKRQHVSGIGNIVHVKG